MEKKPDRKASSGVSRRDFIKGMGTGALGTAVLPPLLGQTIVTRKGRVPVYEKKTITLTVNGRPVSLEVAANETLLDVLRDRLDLTGAKKVCDRGECGGCTVHLDGEPVYACMIARHPRRRPDRPDGRRPGRGRQAPPRPGGLHREGRLPVRLLHARLHHGQRRPSSRRSRPRRATRSSRPCPGTSAAAATTPRSTTPSTPPRKS